MTDCVYNAGISDSGVVCLNMHDLLHSGSVPVSFCGECPYQKPASSKGIGDVVGKVIKAVGFKKSKDCGCGKRQASLNKWMPSKKRDDRWFVAVTTAPRYVPTLSVCLESLTQCGWHPVVFAEPDSIEVAGYEHHKNEQRLGVWHNWLNACRVALQSDAEYIMTVQDDSLFHPDCKAIMDSITWPTNAGFISLYTPRHYSHQRNGRTAPNGIVPVTTYSLWGACAIAWQRKTLEQVINHPKALAWQGARPKSKATREDVMQRRREHPELIANSDAAIGVIVNRMGRKMYFANPSPVQHIAAVSTIAHGGNSGNRNCGYCADHREPLFDQLFPRQGVEVDDNLHHQAWRTMMPYLLKPTFAICGTLWSEIRNTVKPGMRTAEFGSGISTAAFDGCDHVAIEQDAYRCKMHASIRHHPLGASEWYTGVPDSLAVDVLLVDGPFGGDRSHAAAYCNETLRKGGAVFVDDAGRSDSIRLMDLIDNTLVAGRCTTDDDGRKWAKFTGF